MDRPAASAGRRPPDTDAANDPMSPSPAPLPSVARAALAALCLAACGGADATPDVSERPGPAPAPAAEARDPSPGEAIGGAAKRLQGTWEIVRYESSSSLPPEAMPIMGELFDALRIRFDGRDAVVQIGEASPDRRAFSIRDEDGDGFRLSVPGGMFDGAVVRFVGEDEIEIDDPSETWAGTSRLRRVR